MGRTSTLAVSFTLAAVALACAHAPAQPAAAPDRDALSRFLESSVLAGAVADAAETEGLLSSSESDIEDLEIVAESLGIGTVSQLSERLEPLVDDAPTLFAALEQRRRGSRTGDVAHWVAVALLALDQTPPHEQYFRDRIDWESDYINDVLDLRRINDEGGLLELALGNAERQPVSYDFAVIPHVDPELRPRILPRRDTGFWPVFASPGDLTMGGTVALERDHDLGWDELHVLVRTPGDVRVLEVPQQPLARFRLAEDGGLSPYGTTELVVDQHLGLLVQIPGQENLALIEPGVVVRLPWEGNCCQLIRRADADWWVRLTNGRFAGAWVQASTDAFRVSPNAAVLARRRAERTERPAPRLGSLGRAGTIDLPGARIAYWLAGSPEEPPLMVLHGGPGIGSRYLRAPLQLSVGWNRLLFFYDQRGSGYSEGAEAPEQLTMENFVADVEAMRRASEVDRIDILGHSFGGLVALHYALRNPERVGRLVLVEPDPASRDLWETHEGRIAVRTSPEDVARMEEIAAAPGWQTDPQALTDWFAVRLRAYMASPERAAEIDMRFDEMTAPNWVATYPVARENLGDWDIHGALSRVTTPTLIIAGSESVFTPEAMRALHAALPNSRLEIVDGAGHFPFIEAQGSFLTLVAEFLER
jgi:proline iminopeptidase